MRRESKPDVEDSGGRKDVTKEDKIVKKDSKDTPVIQKEPGEESKSHQVSAAENKTSEPPLDRPGPNESHTVTAEKVEKLASPPPERVDADVAAGNEPLENERFINNVLNRLRKLRGSNE